MSIVWVLVGNYSDFLPETLMLGAGLVALFRAALPRPATAEV